MSGRRIGFAAAGLLLLIYSATLAPSVTLWDSGEFLAAIHSLGIPHPPGTPLYILVANVWARAIAPLIGFTLAVNLFSAMCAAVSCGLMASLFARWTGNRVGALAGGVTAGAMSTVWLSANEAEVYSAAMLIACTMLVAGDRARVTRNARWLVMLAYLAGIAWALHLSALVALPPAVLLALSANAEGKRYQVTQWQIAPVVILAALLGASAVLFLLLRAPHDPFVNQGNPESWNAFVDVLMRRQYRPAPLFPRQAPWFIQIGNLFEYADWQIALGVDPDAPPSWRRTPLSIVYAALGVAGAMRHRSIDRVSWRAMSLFLLTATLGVIVYLNMKAGPSFGGDFLPPGAGHEARERDYFFSLAFICWGMWAGLGAVYLAQSHARESGGNGMLRGGLAGLVVAVVPVTLNWSAVDRRSEPRASEPRNHAMSTLTHAPRNAVILSNADNDTYPVWYAQQVEGIRRDVTLVTIPLLPASWYRAELQRRHQIGAGMDPRNWVGLDATLNAVCADARALGRPIVAPLRAVPRLPGSCSITR